MKGDEWWHNQPSEKWRRTFGQDGYLVVKDIIQGDDLNQVQDICKRVYSIENCKHRHDLGSHKERNEFQTENVCQIMWPSLYEESLRSSKLYTRAEELAKLILGEDMVFDFDNIICKAPKTNTETPIHQDESYWFKEMTDKRAVSIWTAMDDVTVENGCMWFQPGSHLYGVEKHRPVAEGKHILCCDGDLSKFNAEPIKAGSCTLHHGRTRHYSKGNSTEMNRMALIMVFRPKAMVDFERENGHDHGLKGLQDVIAKTGTHEKAEDS